MDRRGTNNKKNGAIELHPKSWTPVQRFGVFFYEQVQRGSADVF
jgi:hypothetical protein